MIRDLKRIEGMTNKEIMYIIASEYIDDICKKAVDTADEIMSNPIVKEIVLQAAVTKLGYEEKRKEILVEGKEEDCFYNFYREDLRAYKTVLYNSLFHHYGGNSADV